MLTILVFFITILILVLIHELGHFLVAKKFNIKVLEFGFGLPPRAIGKKIGETIYSFNWLPIGGFVRLLGEDETNKNLLEDKRSFATQTVGKKIAVVIAGVTMNLLLAWLLFYLILASQNFKFQIELINDHQFFGVRQTVDNLILIGSVAKDSPAAQAGILGRERVLSLNGQSLENMDKFISEVKKNAGREILLALSDIDKKNIREVKVTPRETPPPGQGALGVTLGSIRLANLDYQDPVSRIFAGPIHGYNLTVYSFKLLGQTIASSFAQKDIAPVSRSVAGPIGIGSIIGNILSIKDPIIPYLNFMAMLSLNLAIVNILPFPALDGGRLVFLLFEATTRKRAHPVLEKYIHTIGMMILIALIILVTFSDIKKLVF